MNDSTFPKYETSKTTRLVKVVEPSTQRLTALLDKVAKHSAGLGCDWLGLVQVSSWRKATYR